MARDRRPVASVDGGGPPSRRPVPSDKGRQRAARARPGLIVVAVAVVFTGLVVVHQVHRANGTTHTIRPAPAFGVGVANCTFVDHTRGTYDYLTGTTAA